MDPTTSPSRTPLTGAQSFQDLTRAVVEQLSDGVGQPEVTEQLVARGWPRVSAVEFVARQAQTAGVLRQLAVADDEERQYIAALYKRRMKRGLLWALGGLTVSLFSLELAQAGGGASFVFFGAMMVGVIDFLAALVGWWRTRR